MAVRIDVQKDGEGAMKAMLGLERYLHGCGLEQGRFLSPGDVVELEVERLGRLRNRVVR